MKITLSAAHHANVLRALEHFWRYYYNEAFTDTEARTTKALGTLLAEHPSIFHAIVTGTEHIPTIAFLASYLHKEPKVWLHATGLLRANT